jgi:transcriptional regulator with XRE-family HTH domain
MDEAIRLRLLFGQNLRAARLAARQTQGELAAKVGMTRSFVAAVERGEIDLTLSAIVALAVAVGRDPLSLLE